MSGDEGTFWDRRYRAEGEIWGDGPSPTALAAAPHLRAIPTKAAGRPRRSQLQRHSPRRPPDLFHADD